jgi:hypothetical protein
MDTESRLAAIEAKLREMEDREAIHACIRRNARGNDRFDAELTDSSYHEDAIHELGERQISGREYGEHANHGHALISDATMHTVAMHSCEIDGDVAHAESYVIGLFADPGGEMSRMLGGRYIDRLEKRDGEWRIVVRRATVEVAMEGKAVLPNGKSPPGSGYLMGDRDRSDLSYARPLTLEGGKRW